MSADEMQDRIAYWRQTQPRFDTTGLLPWTVEGLAAGWVSPTLADRLLQSELFLSEGRGLALDPRLGGPLMRSRALQELAEQLRDEGWIKGWRDERYDWMDDWGRVRFNLERSAFRTLGLCSRAIHVNGYIEDGGLWLGTRATHKSVDPGKLDNLTAGGISSGESPEDTLQRELAEEAGVPTRLAGFARPVGILRSQRREPDGVHDELLYCYDLPLPDDFAPVNTDGEVSQFQLLQPPQVAEQLGAMTWDAAAVTVAWLGRWLDGEC
ncbi:MAG: DUF4743 domain-containing protein [Chitinimonas sp.]|nr:DUF4743 domain-containing protein [Chitinimonas sp.]